MQKEKQKIGLGTREIMPDEENSKTYLEH